MTDHTMNVFLISTRSPEYKYFATFTVYISCWLFYSTGDLPAPPVSMRAARLLHKKRDYAAAFGC